MRNPMAFRRLATSPANEANHRLLDAHQRISLTASTISFAANTMGGVMMVCQ